MKDRRLLFLALGVGVVVILGVFFLFGRGGGDTAEVVVVPDRTVQPSPEVTEEPGGVSTFDGTGGTVFGTSARDPFAPQATPSDQANSDSGNNSSSSSSSSSSKNSSKTTNNSTTNKSTKNSPSGSGSKDGSGDSKKSSKDKTPKPVGGGGSKDNPREQVDLRVVDVQDSLAVVRINGSRSTLFLNVPDASGVVYVSALGGDCGWFSTTGDAADRLTICEGETRQL